MKDNTAALSRQDVILVERLQQADPEGARMLVETFASRLFNYAYYHIGDFHSAEDIVAEVLARVIEKIDTYSLRDDIPFKAWVFRIAHNRIADYYRQRQRRPEISLEKVDWDTVVVEGIDDPGGTVMLERETLRTALLTLPEDQRTVILMHFIEGLSSAEIAAALHKTLPAIKSLQYRAMQTLRSELKTPISAPAAHMPEEGRA